MAVTDRVLAAIGAALDAAIDSSDADLDWSLNDGVLSLTVPAAPRKVRTGGFADGIVRSVTGWSEGTDR